MDKSSIQNKAVFSLLKMLYKQKYDKFALSLQIQFEANKVDEKTNVAIKNLLLKELEAKGENSGNIVDYGNAFECSILPEINALSVSHDQIFAIFNTECSIEESMGIIKNIIRGMSDMFAESLVTKRLGMAINYKWSYKKSMAKDTMYMRQFVISSNEMLEDNLNFNIIMQQEVLEKIVALDLFSNEKLTGDNLISKIEILVHNVINNWSLEKILLKLNSAK